MGSTPRRAPAANAATALEGRYLVHRLIVHAIGGETDRWQGQFVTRAEGFACRRLRLGRKETSRLGSTHYAALENNSPYLDHSPLRLTS